MARSASVPCRAGEWCRSSRCSAWNIVTIGDRGGPCTPCLALSKVARRRRNQLLRRSARGCLPASALRGGPAFHVFTFSRDTPSPETRGVSANRKAASADGYGRVSPLGHAMARCGTENVANGTWLARRASRPGTQRPVLARKGCPAAVAMLGDLLCKPRSFRAGRTHAIFGMRRPFRTTCQDRNNLHELPDMPDMPALLTGVKDHAPAAPRPGSAGSPRDSGPVPAPRATPAPRPASRALPATAHCSAPPAPTSPADAAR